MNVKFLNYRVTKILITICIMLSLILACPYISYADTENADTRYNADPSYTEATNALDYCRAVSEHISEESGDTANTVTTRLLVGTYGEYEFSRFDGITDIIYDGNCRYVVQFENSASAKAALTLLSSDPDIRYVERDALVRAENTVLNASASERSWGINAMGIDKYSGYVARLNPSTITVAVLDTGCADEHELFTGRLVDGYNIVGDNYYTEDEGGHGTHVSGIIADCTGANSNIKIMPVSVMYSSGFGYASLSAAGIDYAVARNADVINMSFSYAHESNYMEDSINAALAKGCICVAAAGNQAGDTSDRCPAHIDGVITVGAVNKDLTIADYSNHGDAIDVVAPGTDICSAGLNGTYVTQSGTSMSAPHISACMALLKSANSELSASQLDQLLISSCVDLGDSGKDSTFGYGIPDMSKLIPEEAPAPVVSQPTIAPKGTSIRKIKASKKALKISWKKQSSKLQGKRIKGYQIQLSSTPDFSSVLKTLTIKGYKKTTKNLSRLTRKTKYYCRIRTYIQISGTTYYSSWSGVKTARTK